MPIFAAWDLFKRRRWLPVSHHDKGLDGLSPEGIGYADNAAFHHRRVLHQHIFHLIGADPVTAGFDDVVETAVEPEAARFIPVDGIPGVVDPIPPDPTVLLLIVQIPGKDTHLFPVLRGGE